MPRRGRCLSSPGPILSLWLKANLRPADLMIIGERMATLHQNLEPIGAKGINKLTATDTPTRITVQYSTCSNHTPYAIPNSVLYDGSTVVST